MGRSGASTNTGPVETYVMRVVCFYFVSVSLSHSVVYSVWATAVYIYQVNGAMKSNLTRYQSVVMNNNSDPLHKFFP